MKNTNTLVVCGGTGAHVALAFVRLHTLGQPLGFFRDADGAPLAFPTVYLVDQDSGDGDQEATAWQLTRRLVASHPGRYDWRAAIGRPDAPDLKIVTPLPVGPDRAWFNPPYDTLGRRFADSPYLDLLASRAQRDIRFSHGMMGSPAVGSLLFRLKDLDTKSGGDVTNHDGTYHELLGRRGRVAVVGSAVGGTGASVAPTLAQRLADDGGDVMAVMVLNWFRFEHEGLDEATLEKAQRRDRSMVDNANSAFAHYGQALAPRVATVPVGAPDAAIKVRRYTSDTGQPIRESFLHGVAALCGLHHFVDREPCGPGLYQMGAEDPTRIGGGNHLPGGAGGNSVQSLANQAATLVDVLEVLAKTLSERLGRGPFRVAPAICTAVDSPERVGPALARLAAEYREHVAWMRDVLGVVPKPDPSLTREALSRKRLATHRIEPQRRGDGAGEDAAALALLHWTADWIHDHACGRGRAALVVPPAEAAHGGYWPPLVGHDSLNVATEEPGRLTQVSDQNIQGTVQGFIHQKHVAENGWPNPMAAVDHFRYAIEHGRPTECRQLKMLLTGLVMERLTLSDIAPRTNPPVLSLDHLVDQYRREQLPDFARVAVVHTRGDGEVVLGFNSPHTLLCPTPIAVDEKREAAWGALWQALTGSEQPLEWRTEAMDRWCPAARALRQIRTWIAKEKQVHGGAPPPWIQVFEHDAQEDPAAFGMGRKLYVFWETGSEPPTRIALPTTSSRGGWWPDEDTPRITEDQLLTQTPALISVETGAGVTFEMAKFKLPDRDTPTRALWGEHLDHLQLSGGIATFGVKSDERRLAILTADHRTAAVLDNVVLLDRDDLMVSECAPMRQDPVPGSSTRPGRLRYPDYPLRADYLGLVQTDDGRRVVDLLKQGKSAEVSRSLDASRPTVDEARGQSSATWELHLAGRSDRLPFTLPVPPEALGTVEQPRAAHWMVWPRFRSKEAPYWRAYYVYEHCTDEKLHLSTLWFDPDDDCVRRCAAPEVAGAHPVGFEGGDQRAHTGGPPLALSLENPQSGQELGLYVIDLTPLGRRQGNVKVGIDFGTSHTVAAVQADGGPEGLVELPPELASARLSPLTLHVSEDWSHVTGGGGKPGLKALGEWLPTYTDEDALKEMQGLLPSELLTIAPLSTLSASDPARWQPGRDCVIPFMDMQRSDLADHLLSDFKWRASSEAFKDREPVLREVYLGMAMELVMADIVWRRLEALPARVEFTFTYPLRDPAEQVKDYQRTLRRVLESGARSLGGELGFTDNIGIYNESSAAKGGTRVFGEVCLVGDLGGGTLDLFISANDGPGIDFEEVADSAKLGGNELLRTMAEQADLFLPPGWAGRPGDVQTRLRAWMRSKGSALLLGRRTGEAERHVGLDLAGFAQPGAAKATRALIERYFRLVVEYMARSLVAYLVRHWYPKVLEQRPDDLNRLSVLVQLRGNGWRLWPEASYASIERKVARDVEARAAELWRDRTGDRNAWRGLDDQWRQHGLWKTAKEEGGDGPAVGPPNCVPEESPGENPKAAPIRRVVGHALPHEKIQARAHSHALVELQVMTQRPTAGGGDEPRIRWFDRLPAPVGGDGAKVEFHRVEPPFPLSHPDAAGGARRELDDLEPGLKNDINRALDELGFTRDARFDAPIAPIVWEHAFRSKRFVEGK